MLPVYRSLKHPLEPTRRSPGAIPNQGSGIVIRGEAHGNAIGGFQPSVEPQTFVSGNLRYGIAVMDRAYNNSIFHTAIGRGAALTAARIRSFQI